MNYCRRLLAAACALIAGATCAANAPHEIWRCHGLRQPESVVYDAPRHRYYVSNMIGDAEKADGVGAISIVSERGNLENPDWVAGLNAPKGMAIVGNVLYVADIHDVVLIDISAGRILQRIPVQGSVGLNDVAAAPDGTVYVSDVFGDSIYTVSARGAELWLHDSRLQAPNGVFADAQHVYVGSWGHIKQGVETDAPGHILRVDRQTRTISQTSGPIGNIDGLAMVSDGTFLLTDFMRGEVLAVRGTEQPTPLIHLQRGSADLTYVPALRMILVPEMLAGDVTAIQLGESQIADIARAQTHESE